LTSVHIIARVHNTTVRERVFKGEGEQEKDILSILAQRYVIEGISPAAG
jgi:hypothetical protein